MRAHLLIATLTAVALLAGAGDAAARTRGAFERHLREAIRLNQSRLPLYSAASQGASEDVSRKLIASERLALPVAMGVDRIARWWQERGVPIVEEDFVDLKFAPEFEPASANPQPLSSYKRQDASEMAARLRKAQRAGGFDGVCRAARVELERLEGTRSYHAMVRHVLESTLRSAHLAPKHETLARSKGLPSTAWLSRRLIGLNLLALIGAAELDERAAPLHARGIPILHRDVPPIGTHSDFYDGAAARKP
ncbi:MAG: hypothetical protein HYY25_03545 [Candidatus Wallbacteria bacterium]|nr:hypothetical protein [Candidatus Wallbacteria bacterium]